MANEKSLLLTIGGDYVNTDLAAEGWQVGIRCALVDGSIDPIGTFPNDWEVKGDTVSRTEADWTITGNWQIERFTDTFHADDWLNDQVAPAVATWALRSGCSDQVRVRTLKAYPIGAPTGKAIPAPGLGMGTPMLLEWTSSYPVGSNSGQLLPLQIAAVASHRTSQVGRAGRGRNFLPGLTAGMLDANTTMSATGAQNWRDAQVALLEGIALAAGGLQPYNLQPCVTGGNYTQYAVIDHVIVDTILDTQRRRRRQLVGASFTAPVTY
jgi:hypothetical protein